MPSTDIDGSPILILSVEDARVVRTLLRITESCNVASLNEHFGKTSCA